MSGPISIELLEGLGIDAIIDMAADMTSEPYAARTSSGTARSAGEQARPGGREGGGSGGDGGGHGEGGAMAAAGAKLGGARARNQRGRGSKEVERSAAAIAADRAALERQRLSALASIERKFSKREEELQREEARASSGDATARKPPHLPVLATDAGALL